MPFSRRASLQYRLPALMCALVLAVVAVYGTASYVEVGRAAVIAASERLERVTDEMAQLLTGMVGQARAQAGSIARSELVYSLFRSPATRSAGLDSLFGISLGGRRPIAAAIELWDMDGRRLAVARRAPLLEPDAIHSLLGAVSATSPVVAGPLRADANTQLYPLVIRVADGAGALGHLVLWRPVAMRDQGRQGLSALIGSDARLVLGNADGSFWTDLVAPIAAPPIDPTSMDHVVAYERAGVGALLASAAAIGNTPWMVVIEFPRARVLAPAQAALRRLGLYAVLLLLAGAIAAWAVGRSLTRPLGELARTANAIAGGDYARRARVTRRDELGVLASAFNTMAQSVADGRRELESHARELERQATDLTAQATEMEAANQGLIDAVDEAERARVALEGALRDNARIAAELNAALASAPVGFAFFDAGLRFRRVNAQLATLNRRPVEQHIGRTLREVMPEVASVVEEHVQRVLASGESVANVDLSRATTDEPTAARHWLASFYPVRVDEDGGELLGVGAVITDLTSYKELEQQFLQAQKMEAIGRLAGGLAHDFNNMLTAISGFTQFAASQLPEESPARVDMAQVEFATTRAAALTRQLLAFSRQQVLQPQPIDLNDVVRRMETLLRRLLGSDITLRCELEPNIWQIRIDPVQIDHAIMNLAINARDAMPHGGSLVLGTTNVVLDRAQIRSLHLEVEPGSFVVLSVEDSGLGMSAATRERIFEPFFTTKEPGKGTGLGLATVHGIVRQSGGGIRVQSEPGRGTSFRVFLPRYDGAEEPGPRETAAVPSPAVPASVLLVDDEPAVQAAMRRTLELAGYTVHVAANGREGLAVAEAMAGTLDIVVTDLVMPDVGGRELARRLAERWPRLRVLFISGYSTDAIGGAILDPHDAFLEKPFTPSELVATVQRVLRRDDARRAAGGPSALGIAS